MMITIIILMLLIIVERVLKLLDVAVEIIMLFQILVIFLLECFEYVEKEMKMFETIETQLYESTYTVILSNLFSVFIILLACMYVSVGGKMFESIETWLAMKNQTANTGT